MDKVVKVWDPFVRVFHWVLVVAFFTAFFTEGEQWLGVHVNAGYIVLALVLMRIVWGFVGSRYARFSDFAYSPVSSVEYAMKVLKRSAPRYIGHNPAGALMIFVLLFMLLATTISGLLVYGEDQHAGPMKSFFAAESSAKTATESIGAEATERDEDEANENKSAGKGDEEEEFLEELHDSLADITLFLVAIHVLGVIIESLVHKENLARAMVTGRKRADEQSVG
ncbi:MAG: cytochrome b/b6 domain-containing protein [Gammaproteobacteria bacterium]